MYFEPHEKLYIYIYMNEIQLAVNFRIVKVDNIA